MSNWKERLSFVSPPGVDSPVQGTTQKFYPISVSMAFKLRVAAKDIAKALSNLFADRRGDSETVETSNPTDKKTTDGKTVLFERTIISRASTPGTAEFRDRQREKAIHDLISTVTEPENAKVVAMVIIDSMRDVFPDPKEAPPPEEFLAQPGTLAALPEMLIGVAKANKGVLDPLTKALGVTDLGARAKKAMEKTFSQANGTDGSNSKTE